MKKVLVLGSTGSIGINALSVVKNFAADFRITGLSANRNTCALLSQVRRFKPGYVCVSDPSAALRVRRNIPSGTRFFSGDDGLAELVNRADFDILVMAVSGSAATLPLLAALKKGKRVALANKESLVMAGKIIMSQQRRYRSQIIPVDSEQSAIWQCIAAESCRSIAKIYITASGGPLRNVPFHKFKGISREIILRHPKWRMGSKITVDSATLMNKGFEVIEARWLFDVDAGNIDVLVHPEVIVHSMCEFRDGSILAQLAKADMRLPIQYALTYPRRFARMIEQVDFLKVGKLTFEKPDTRKFPCLGFAYSALRDSGLAPCVLNAASDTATSAFLGARLDFSSIPRVIERVLSKMSNKKDPSLAEILEADSWARQESENVIASAKRLS